MHLEALEKVISIAKKNPKILLSPDFFKKISTRLNIDVEKHSDNMVFTKNGRRAEAVIITAQNCAEHKCIVREGQKGIKIFEYIKALVELLTDQVIPASPHEKLGQTAIYYCEKGIPILQKEFFE